MRKLLLALAAAPLLAAVPAGAAPVQGQVLVQAPAGVETVQYRRYYGRPYYRYRRPYGYYDGPGVAAGVAGLAAGALIGGAIANSAQAQPLPKTQDPGFIAFCSRKYRSFDPVSGTYLGRDGQRSMCEYP